MPHSRVIITPEGMISCQGDTLMSGYIGDPELTATVLRGDTVYMSDYGSIDNEGMLHIGGRESDVINVGGYKVAPTEVEDVTMSIEGVRDCICIPAEHPIMGKAVKLLVVMNDGVAFDKKHIARYIAARLEPYKVPQLYEQVESIARTYNGKLDRKHYQ
jgi:acyl-coenzyme A synthetase/AMP-(fatty) acid ligase